MIYLYFAAFIVAFAVLFKSASFFVAGASSIARILDVPKLVIGIVLVGLGTTAPEFGVTLYAAIMGKGEIAIGNAIGSVICDDGVALALAAIVAPAVIFVNCRILKVMGLFLISIDVLAYVLAQNGRLGRIEGFCLVLILCVYYVFIIRHQRRNQSRSQERVSNQLDNQSLKRPITLFLLGLAGVASMSFVVVQSAVKIAEHFEISEIIIGSTIVAIGTSLPEISTCITAALKGEGEIAVGDIIGADILNILWIIGVASLVKPIEVDLDIINFSFPYMILIVVVMLLSLRIGCRLTKFKGIILLVLYGFYIFLMLYIFV
ncbi:MAG: calcium/sodium antiporter [Candidatus Aminicenantes bacterium]|nr:MAG: calcium/sodium antiporter [Candidatus Aminicenantes bacterium]